MGNARAWPSQHPGRSRCTLRPRESAAAGVILFFTCVSAVVAPLAIGAAGDAFADIMYGYWLATGFAVLLFGGSVLNWTLDPTGAMLASRDATEYVSATADPAAR